ncbi:MAG: hypothetical protein ACP5NY_01755 [Thermocladium sp.]
MLTMGTIIVKQIMGGEYVYIYVGDVEALKRLRGNEYMNDSIRRLRISTLKGKVSSI